MQPYTEVIAGAPEARVRLVGLPHDKNSSFLRGSADGPAAIRRALFSDSANLFTENGHDLSSSELLMDAGDVVFDGADDFEAIVAAAAAAGRRTADIPRRRPFRDLARRPGHGRGPSRASRSSISTPTPTRMTSLPAAAPPTPARLPGSWRKGLAARLVSVGIRTMTAHQARAGRPLRHRGP